MRVDFGSDHTMPYSRLMPTEEQRVLNEVLKHAREHLTSLRTERTNLASRIAQLDTAVAAAARREAAALLLLGQHDPEDGPHAEASADGVALAERRRDRASVAEPVSAKEAMPSPSEGIERLLREAGDSGLSFPELYTQFEQRGWLNPDNADPKLALRAALSRVRRLDGYYAERGRTFYGRPASFFDREEQS